MILLMFFKLCCGHALADFPLQGEFLAKGKNRHTPTFGVPPGQTPQRIWIHCLSAHALIHAGTVGVITGRWDYAVAEGVLHWAIDFAKCENWTGIHTDQILHYVCKLVWAVGYVWWPRY